MLGKRFDNQILSGGHGGWNDRHGWSRGLGALQRLKLWVIWIGSDHGRTVYAAIMPLGRPAGTGVHVVFV